MSEPKTHLSATKLEATREWIENYIIPSEEPEDDLESMAESSVIESSEAESESSTDLDEEDVTTSTLGTQIVPSETTIENLRELFNSINSVQTVGNVKIENSTGVHIGNITNIKNVQIIHAGDGNQAGSKRTPKSHRKATSKPKPHATEEREERVNKDAFLERVKFKIPKDVVDVVRRSTWIAQLPMEEYKYIPEPTEYVVILHTATESSLKQAINIRIIRDIQCFHIESREWNDIAYNFLVGCDGNIYEGRGWGVVGAHTKGYNTIALGIAFIGCFMRELPTEAALNACKAFLKKGVAEGHLAANYKLICHCQCRSTESPGRKLFEEIQTWDHFYNIEDEAA